MVRCMLPGDGDDGGDDLSSGSNASAKEEKEKEDEDRYSANTAEKSVRRAITGLSIVRHRQYHPPPLHLYLLLPSSTLT